MGGPFWTRKTRSKAGLWWFRQRQIGTRARLAGTGVGSDGRLTRIPFCEVIASRARDGQAVRRFGVGTVGIAVRRSGSVDDIGVALAADPETAVLVDDVL